MSMLTFWMLLAGTIAVAFVGGCIWVDLHSKLPHKWKRYGA